MDANEIRELIQAEISKISGMEQALFRKRDGALDGHSADTQLFSRFLDVMLSFQRSMDEVGLRLKGVEEKINYIEWALIHSPVKLTPRERADPKDRPPGSSL